MNFKAQESATKLRGGYYTPAPVADFLVRWLSNSGPGSVLEPSCGDGAFIRAFAEHVADPTQFIGVELLEEEARKAQDIQVPDTLRVNIINADFLEWSIQQLDGGQTYDAIAGNPPYIRYQYLNPTDQVLAEQIFRRYGLPFTKHTNAWVSFVIASIGLLAPGGRLAMVIPSEILHVLHARSLRKFLLSETTRIFFIDPTELLFEEALQGTMLLMLEKKAVSTEINQGVGIFNASNNNFLNGDPEAYFANAEYVAGEVLNGKWMKLFLSHDELEIFERIKQFPAIRKFTDIATVDVGIVTGANKFFLVNQSIVREYGLERFAEPMFGRSDHCPGIIYNNDVHQANQANGLPAYFINFGQTPFDDLPTSAQEYILMGEEHEFHTRYKTRIRKPWYAVPSIYATSIGMLKRSHNFPRLILNTINAYTTDTAYRICPVNDAIDPRLLVFSFVNSLTALTAELEGRHYGGGVLELVPSEIENLLIPIPNLAQFDLESLDQRIRNSENVDLILREQDQQVLLQAGVTADEAEIIHSAWSRIRNRRQRLVEDLDLVIE